MFLLGLEIFFQKGLKNKKGDEKKKIDPGGNQKFSGNIFKSITEIGNISSYC